MPFICSKIIFRSGLRENWEPLSDFTSDKQDKFFRLFYEIRAIASPSHLGQTDNWPLNRKIAEKRLN
jgi:hypothetical protein